MPFTVGDDPAAVRANRMALQKRLGLTHWVEAKKVNGVHIRLDPPPGDIEADGEAEDDCLNTAEPGRALVIKTEDGQPVRIAHRGCACFAALPLGWRCNDKDLPL
ncbi:hypothetical protein DQK91_22490 [Oceanidesulfovibrio marinus]|uniref:Uncharacterized protein n=1 Tax=Oceanidesulfovibrio marinus TaxID=370038 RepID=A0A6P1Z9B9_9BACT|nr:hypothetical protein DQK91_22490 [Oceanidesulfovibrio marinus]